MESTLIQRRKRKRIDHHNRQILPTHPPGAHWNPFNSTRRLSLLLTMPQLLLRLNRKLSNTLPKLLPWITYSTASYTTKMTVSNRQVWKSTKQVSKGCLIILNHPARNRPQRLRKMKRTERQKKTMRSLACLAGCWVHRPLIQPKLSQFYRRITERLNCWRC